MIHVNNINFFFPGIGVHIKEKIVLFSDSDGKVHLVYTNSSNEVKKNIYPSLVHPKSISIDWLDNKAYIAGDDKVCLQLEAIKLLTYT